MAESNPSLASTASSAAPAVQQPPARRQPEETKRPIGKSADALRREYDDLAAQVADAAAAGNKGDLAKLMNQKKAAHAAWWTASAPERKAAKGKPPR